MMYQLGLQLVLPAIAIVMLWRARPPSKLKWLTDTAAVFLALLFSFTTAHWELLSYYLRSSLPLLFALAALKAYRRIEATPSPNTFNHRLRVNGVNFILISIFGWLNLNAVSGYFYPGAAVELTYPLRDGVYYVGGGGGNLWINHHNGYPPQNYALDIVQLNGFGRPGGDPDILARSAIFGQPIYSPCTGRVAAAVDGRPDQVPPHSDPVNIAGNHVLINCQNAEILLAHMQQGSVTVEEGDAVHEGQIIGAVGNSGQSTEPHLHIHAERGGLANKILNGQSVPITFNKRFLVRNSLFTGGSSQ